MKKIALAITAVVAIMGAIAPAYAYDHHRPVCHKVKQHGHWTKVCH